MNNCFITKYLKAVDNDNLPRLNGFMIRVSTSLPNITKTAYDADRKIGRISFACVPNTTLKVYTTNGKAMISASQDLSNPVSEIEISTHDWKATTNLYLLWGDYNVVVENKYNISVIKPWKDDGKFNYKVDLSELKYCTNINFIYSVGQTDGSIENLKNLTNLIWLRLRNTQVSGSVENLKNLTNLTQFDLSNTQVSGSIEFLKNLTNLTYLNLSNTQVSGSIEFLKNLTNLTYLDLGHIQVSGSIENVKNLTNLTYLDLNSPDVDTDGWKDWLINCYESNNNHANIQFVLSKNILDSNDVPRFIVVSFSANTISLKDSKNRTLNGVKGSDGTWTWA